MILRQLLLVLGAFFVLSLPLWPAIQEALWPSDEEPLSIARGQLQDPRGGFKQVAWRYCVMFGLTEPGQLFAWLVRQEAGELAPGVFHFVGGGEVPGDFTGTDGVASGTLRLPAGGRCSTRIFSTKNIEIGERGEAFEAHAGAALRMEPGSRLLWWGTGSNIHVGRGARAVGALRAEQEIQLEPGASFLLLRAPRIGVGRLTAQGTADRSDATSAHHPPRHGMRQVIDGDHELYAGETIEGDLIVRGDLQVAEGVRIHGSLKAYGSIALGAGATVRGSVVAIGGVLLGARTRVEGCVLGERWVSLGAGACVGKPGGLVTLSGETVQLASGAQVHGMIRAWKGGQVVES